MQEKKKYFAINSLRLARALSFLGFDYMVFIKDDGNNVYSFEITEEFMEAKKLILDAKRKYDK